METILREVRFDSLEVLSIVQAMAIEKQFSLVLEVSTGGVAFFDPTLDITEEVIRRYNEAQKK